jgi:hypothetical protein
VRWGGGEEQQYQLEPPRGSSLNKTQPRFSSDYLQHTGDEIDQEAETECERESAATRGENLPFPCDTPAHPQPWRRALAAGNPRHTAVFLLRPSLTPTPPGFTPPTIPSFVLPSPPSKGTTSVAVPIGATAEGLTVEPTVHVEPLPHTHGAELLARHGLDQPVLLQNPHMHHRTAITTTCIRYISATLTQPIRSCTTLAAAQHRSFRISSPKPFSASPIVIE